MIKYIHKFSNRGQFFLLGAFIIAAVIIGIGKVSNDLLSPTPPFSSREVRDEIEREAQVSVSYALNNHKNVSEIIENFSRNYIAYSRSSVFNSQYFFLYADEEEILFMASGDKNYIKVDAGSVNLPLSDADGDFLKLVIPRANVNQVRVAFYGSENIFDLKERDFHYIVRGEDEKGIYVAI